MTALTTLDDVARQVLVAAGARQWSLATAESLTGGAVAATLVNIPGASEVLRGSVVSYATDVKASVLGVDAVLLADRGPIDPVVAGQMARGARRVLGADIGLATTGVAGPTEQCGHPVGEVYVAVATPTGGGVKVVTRRLRLSGPRAAVRAGAVRGVLTLTREVLAQVAAE